MKNLLTILTLFLVAVLFACTEDTDEMANSELSADSGSFSLSTNGGGNSSSTGGIITAGEWNDLENWMFWDSLSQVSELNQFATTWNILAKHRVSAQVIGLDSMPIAGETIRLKSSGQLLYSSITDYNGKVEFFINFNQIDSQQINWSELSLETSFTTDSSISAYPTLNRIQQQSNATNQNIEIAFVVDATGSMSDELLFLKNELLDVLQRIKANNQNLRTASVFYRDVGDEYVTRVSSFSADVSQTVQFIQNQSSAGGGDYPEAVHSALNKALNDLQWTSTARTKLIFLLLDAPPHNTNSVKNDLNNSLISSIENGIKIIPIGASGINKETEYLMRNFAIITNGTYVFITNDSGIGNEHITATVGSYQVEFLNDLMVRLVQKYSR